LEPLTDEQRAAFLAAVKKNPKAGNIAALKQLDLVNSNGFSPTRGQLRRLLESEEDLEQEAMEARGHVWAKVESVVWEVAQDKDHPKWDRAAQMLGFARGGPAFGRHDRVEVEHTGVVVVEHERRLTLGDVAALARELAGSGGGVGGVVPVAREILAAPEDR